MAEFKYKTLRGYVGSLVKAEGKMPAHKSRAKIMDAMQLFTLHIDQLIAPLEVNPVNLERAENFSMKTPRDVCEFFDVQCAIHFIKKHKRKFKVKK